MYRVDRNAYRILTGKLKVRRGGHVECTGLTEMHTEF
jgi:hypothetical protein